MMSFGGWTMYMTPSTTTGVTSKRVLVGSRTSADRSTPGSRFLTFSGVIWASSV
jgi:hypothetical protein